MKEIKKEMMKDGLKGAQLSQQKIKKKRGGGGGRWGQNPYFFEAF